MHVLSLEIHCTSHGKLCHLSVLIGFLNLEGDDFDITMDKRGTSPGYESGPVFS